MALGIETNRVRNIVTIDSSTGLHAVSTGGGRVEVEDSVFYGSQDMPNKDCWGDQKQCGNCIKKQGLWIPTFGPFRTDVPKAPMYLDQLIRGGGSWGGTSLYKDLKFIGWEYMRQECGKPQHAIATNYGHVNYHPMANFRRIEFKNTDKSAMFRLDSPSQICGNFVCTGLLNVLVDFRETKYSGIPAPFGMKKDFQVTANNTISVSAEVVPNCKKENDWNAYLCRNDDLGILLFESQDPDKKDRASQPIYIRDDERGFNNKLNAYEI